MSKRQADKFKKLLEMKLVEIRQKVSHRDELITERSNDPMDQLQSRADLDLAIAVIDTNWKTKKAVEKALDLLESGEYGICQDCGEPISPKRLEAVPWTTLCVKCQETRDAEAADAGLEQAA
jgi:DnaK suppressor protein